MVRSQILGVRPTQCAHIFSRSIGSGIEKSEEKEVRLELYRISDAVMQWHGLVDRLSPRLFLQTRGLYYRPSALAIYLKTSMDTECIVSKTS